jgi:hypothetical protein
MSAVMAGTRPVGMKMTRSWRSGFDIRGHPGPKELAKRSQSARKANVKPKNSTKNLFLLVVLRFQHPQKAPAETGVRTLESDH